MQQAVETFAQRHGLEMDVQSRYIDLVSEVGELGKEILQGSRYGADHFRVTPALADEMGDCLFSMLLLLSAARVDAGDAVAGALHKYESRWAAKGDIGSS